MRFFLSILCVMLFFFVLPSKGQAQPGVSANNAVLMEQETGRVLFEQAAHEKQLIASITKIMTAIIAIESGKMHELATTSENAVYTEGSSIYLEQGEKMTIEDLVYGLMLRSGNDAAVTISEHIGGSLDGFVHLMNQKASWLGMTNTHFENPHGLDADEHYSTAYDMAILMRYAMNNEKFREITGSSSYLSENRSYSWQNKNKLVTQLYDHSTGGKTGFTRKSGRTLVSSAEKDDMKLVAVTLNASDDWRDHISMFEWGFENYDMTQLAEKGRKLYQLEGDENSRTGYLHNNLLFPLTEEEQNQIEKESFLLEEAEAEKSYQVGKTVYYLNNGPLVSAPIYAEQPENWFFTEVFMLYKKVIGLDS
ncbi:D-alanyl-D-alanine carboxypeptidase family protein [Lentibacillus sediminis]|uniref:D-alanyl-D-alanine carboxypeptidase family protein n=1 Tax=Lentibacillus sediminis TaxID=1940529 RepID=UPI000C1C009D|nr:D-alanyl-D-alanine carboxypeptidase family protein [Lentibacillus sediminis]